jgi:transposase
MVAVVCKGPPLPVPVALPGSVVVAPGVDLIEGDDGGVVFLWAMAAWCWAAGDVAARRLAAVQLVETASATRRAVAAAFGVDEATMWRWQRGYAAGGVAALEPGVRGPKGPSKLTEAKVAEIVAARARGASVAVIAGEVGVSTRSVSSALRRGGPVADVPAATAPDPVGADLVPVARPRPRTGERQAALGMTL